VVRIAVGLMATMMAVGVNIGVGPGLIMVGMITLGGMIVGKAIGHHGCTSNSLDRCVHMNEFIEDTTVEGEENTYTTTIKCSGKGEYAKCILMLRS